MTVACSLEPRASDLKHIKKAARQFSAAIFGAAMWNRYKWQVYSEGMEMP